MWIVTVPESQAYDTTDKWNVKKCKKKRLIKGQKFRIKKVTTAWTASVFNHGLFDRRTNLVLVLQNMDLVNP